VTQWTRGARMTRVTIPPDEPLDWTVRDQPLYGPPAASVPSAQPVGQPAPGAPAYYYVPQPQLVYVQKLPRTGVAVAALVLMLISVTGAICWLSAFTAALAIVCGHWALGEIKASSSPLRGKSMATWSLILAYPVAIFWLVGLVVAVVRRASGN
jgi:hypothetical protein